MGNGCPSLERLFSKWSFALLKVRSEVSNSTDQARLSNQIQAQFFQDDPDGDLALQLASWRRCPVAHSPHYSEPHETFGWSSILGPSGNSKLSLASFCDLIKERECVRRAPIISTECFAERGLGAFHQFILIRLGREGQDDIWMRLDRRATSKRRLILQLSMGKTPAEDTVRSFHPDLVSRGLIPLG